MAMFEIFSGTTLVGSSSLEHGDPPMGVAFGRFLPAAGYATIQAECINNTSDQSGLKLTVRTPTGVVIQCAGVGITDYSAELDPEDIEVNVLGISYPPYEELFPQHVAQYKEQFG
jgi:hypothetical protein